MKKSKKVIFAQFAVVLAAIPAVILGYASGPPVKKTGAPGDGNCTNCHLGTPTLNSTNITLNTGSAGVYAPGGPKMTWTVTNDDPLGVVYGFQLSARLATDEMNGQAGSLDSTDSGTRVLCSSGSMKTAGQPCPAGAAVQFIEHTAPRTPGVFTFNWTPPATNVGDIHVYIASNAANGNGANTGDRIHLANFTLKPAAAGAIPAIGAGGVVNAWSFQPVISDGMWISLFGTNLAPSTRTWRNDEIVNGQLPKQLDGVSVKINNHDAFVYFISPQQINVQAPGDGAAGMVSVQVTTPSGTSDMVTVNKQAVGPALFTWGADVATEGNKYVGAAFPDGTWVGKPGLLQKAGLATRAAKPDEFVLLFATGCGPTNPAAPAGQVIGSPAPRLTSSVEVRIGGIKADVFDNTGFLIFAGECQFNVKIPANAPDGDLKVDLDIAGVGAPDDHTFLTVQK